MRPERNKALFFCNVLPDGAPDARTAHRATPVDGGYRKYGMNVWPTDTSMLDFAQDDQLGVVPPKRGQSISLSPIHSLIHSSTQSTEGVH